MKKNIFTDKETGKSSKGFYVALGISVLMIGSACLFAYNEGERLKEDDFTAENPSSVSEEAVDKKYTDIPKTTTLRTTEAVAETRVTTVTTAAPATEAHIATIPAAEIAVSEPPSEQQSEESTETAAESLVNVTAPLADISNVISPFSGTELVKNETTGSWQTHNGSDIAAEIGSDVFVISPGEVTAVNDDPLWGTTVVVDHHNGYISKYCGLARDLSVQAGDTLVSGDKIGLVGDTADVESALDPHLHIEITHNGTFLDPLSILKSE